MNKSNGGWKKKKRWDIHAMLLDVSYCRRNGISYINNWSAGIKYEWSASLHNSSDWIMGSARLCPTSPKMLHRVCGSKLSSHSVDFYFPFSRWHWLNRREKKSKSYLWAVKPKPKSVNIQWGPKCWALFKQMITAITQKCIKTTNLRKPEKSIFVLLPGEY